MLPTNGTLFLLFIVYYRLNNEEIWGHFFKGAPQERYKVFIHSSLPNLFDPPRNFNFTIVPTVKSEYGRSVGPMNQLLKSAFNYSISEFDRFIFLSENSIPVKSFNLVLNHFTSTMLNTRPQASDFCIAPTNQWLQLEGDQFFVKHHQWITLNRENTSSIISGIQSNNAEFDVNGISIPSKVGHSDEEFWHHLFLFSRFCKASNKSLSNLMNLKFPHKFEQGNCPTYVYWDDYSDNSVFKVDVKSLHMQDVVGQHIVSPHLSFLLELRRSKSFYFVRKFVDNGNDTFLPQRMFYNKDLNRFKGFRNHSSEGFISLLDAFIHLKIFD
jgi:hypothetical protein